MCRIAVLVFCATVASAQTLPPQAKAPHFPSLEEQLKRAHAIPGSALERLIRANQDFSRLTACDAADSVVPPWVKVHWQKNHSEWTPCDPDDTTCGYPHVLKELFEWMVHHQDLKPVEARIAGGGEVAGEGSENSSIATPGTNVRVSGAQTTLRSESDIRVNFRDPNKILAASNNVSGSGQLAMHFSADAGATWGQSYLPLNTGETFHADPTVDWSSDGTAWAAAVGVNSARTVLKVQSFRSVNGGATWTSAGAISGSQTATDKPMQWIDHSTSSQYKDRIYAIWRNYAAAYMNRRTSKGWDSPIRVSGPETTGSAMGADVKTNASGEVFGFWPDTGSRGIYVVKSTNGGSSYGTPVRIATTFDSYVIAVPAFYERRVLIYVSGGAYRNGTTNHVYAMWTDLSGEPGCTAAANEPGWSTTSTCKTRIWFARSTNGGATWSARVKINDQSAANDQFNPVLAVDETNGNIGAIYYDTIGDPGRTKVDVYHQLSTDGGATWQPAVKITTAMSEETEAGADFGSQFGDYNGLSGFANKFFPSWTDRRSGGREEIWTAPIVTSSQPGFSISGNAGAVDAIVAAGTASATSDASGNYKLAGLAAGTYTVTPSKSGCTFSPASSSVTIASSNVTGVNFTATCTASAFTASTFTISGNAGTSAATLTAGSSSTTSGATNNYTLSGLAPGTYTVTPSKSGCTFSPASSSVSITSSNATAVNFTASCVTTTLFADGFETSTGWDVVDLSNTTGNWTFVPSGTLPTASPHGGGSMAKFNSYDTAIGSQTRIQRTAAFSIPNTASTVTLKFWMYHDPGYPTSADKVQVQVSAGTTWTNIGAPVTRYDGTTGWKQHTIDLTPFQGTTLQLGFAGISAYGNNVFIDDVSVTTP